MSWIEEKSVATLPCGTFRIENQKFAKKYIDKISTAHCTTRVTRFSTFYHAYCKCADVVSCEIEKLGGVCHENRKTAIRSSMRDKEKYGLMEQFV